MGNAWFTAWRTDGGPTLYPSNKTPETSDVLEAGLIFATAILAFSLFLVLPGLHGKDIIFSAIKITVGVFVTASIMLCNFGQEWEVGHIHTLTQYRAGLVEEINATVEVKIGLRSVNITLLADGETVLFNSTGVEIREKINYNERFSWDNLGFTQGRGGFGPFAGKFNQEFRAAQFKGVPYPILWVAEYFTIDGEGIRWGRYYRQAGYYTHIVMWLAFPFWILSMVLMHMVIRYGGYMSFMTGLILFAGNIIYACIRNPNVLIIPIGDNEHGEKLTFTWGWCFFMNLFTAAICTIIGVVIFIMDLRAYEYLATFFGADVLQDYEEIYVTTDDLPVVKAASKPAPPPRQAKPHQNGSAGEEEDETYEDTVLPANRTTVRQFRKRSTAFTKKFQKNKRSSPASGGMEMSKVSNKYIPDDPRPDSIPETKDDVFAQDDYEDTEMGQPNRSFQYRHGSGPMDNNIADED